MEEKLVSIIIPTYNRSLTLQRSIRSVQEQTYKNIEIIIVDDCSTDNTQSIVEKLKNEDGRIKYYKLENNLGACCARNKGIELAVGEYIAFQDSDDEWLPTKLYTQLYQMSEKDAYVSFCKYRRINGSQIIIYPNIKKKHITNGIVDRNALLADSIVSTQTLVAKKECFTHIKFDADLPRLQDYDICVRLSGKYDFLFIDQILTNIYTSEKSISSDWHKLRCAVDMLKNKYIIRNQPNKFLIAYIMTLECIILEDEGYYPIRDRLSIFLSNPSLRGLRNLLKVLFFWLSSKSKRKGESCEK